MWMRPGTTSWRSRPRSIAPTSAITSGRNCSAAPLPGRIIARPSAGAWPTGSGAIRWSIAASSPCTATRRTRFFFVEQVALNYVIFAERLPVNFLPAYCNWMPGDAVPAFDAARGLFVEPYAPHEVIGIMHLAGREQKDRLYTLPRLDGGTVVTSLRYGDSRALCGRPLIADSP